MLWRKKELNLLIAIVAILLVVVLALIAVKLFNNGENPSQSGSSSESTDHESTSTEVVTEEVGDTSHFEKLRKPTRFPIELTEKMIGVPSPISVIIEYYCGNERYLVFEQRALDFPYEIIESEADTITKVDINGYEGIIATYLGGDNTVFTWTDSVSAYYLQSTVFNSDQLIEIANSVEEFDDDLRSHPVTEEITTGNNTLNNKITETYRPSWYPEGMEPEVLADNISYLLIDYYSGDDYCFTYIQTPISNNDIYVDNECSILTNINVAGLNGVMITYTTDSRINMFWSDDKYIYEILSETLTTTEAMRVAESVTAD